MDPIHSASQRPPEPGRGREPPRRTGLRSGGAALGPGQPPAPGPSRGDAGLLMGADSPSAPLSAPRSAPASSLGLGGDFPGRPLPPPLPPRRFAPSSRRPAPLPRPSPAAQSGRRGRPRAPGASAPLRSRPRLPPSFRAAGSAQGPAARPGTARPGTARYGPAQPGPAPPPLPCLRAGVPVAAAARTHTHTGACGLPARQVLRGNCCCCWAAARVRTGFPVRCFSFSRGRGLV